MSGMRSSNIKRNIKSNLRSNMKSEIAKAHISNIEKQNEDLMGSLLAMDDPNFGKDEKKPKKAESPKKMEVPKKDESPFKSRSRYGSQISKPDFGKPKAGRDSFISKNNISVNRSINRSINRRSRNNISRSRSKTPGKSRGQLLDKSKRGVISKEQYKTREDLQKMVEDDKKEDFKPYDSPKKEKKDDYKPYESPKKDDSFDYKYNSRRSKEFDSRRDRSYSNEKRRQPYESRDKDKIDIGKYDSFSNAGSRDYDAPKPMKKTLQEPVKFTNKMDSYEEEKPKENRPYGVFDRKDSYEEEKPKKNFVESRNASKAPMDEQNLEQDLMIVTLKMIITNQKKKINELEENKNELEARNLDKEKKIRDLEEKIDDLETMGKLKDFTGDNTVDVPHLDEKLKNIDEYLNGIKYDPEQNKLIEEIIKKNQEYSDLSKENSNAMTKLKNNISNLKSTLSTLNIGD
jgi:hypothetical protein